MKGFCTLSPSDNRQTAAPLNEAIDFHRASCDLAFDLQSNFQPISLRRGIAEAGRLPLLQSLDSCLSHRRTVRTFSGDYLSLAELRTLLWAAYGQVDGEEGRHTVPSAGGLYVLHPVIWSMRTDGLRPGLYSGYDGGPFPLATPLPDVDKVFLARHVEYDQLAAIVILFGAVSIACEKYGSRGYRYLLLEAGHVAQNICLACSSLGLGSVPIGGFDDLALNRLVGAGEGEVALYAVGIGKSVVP